PSGRTRRASDLSQTRNTIAINANDKLDFTDHEAEQPRRRHTFIRDLLGDPRILCSGLVIFIFIVLAIFAPLVAPYPLDFMDSTRPLDNPSAEHWLGTDQLGRDVLTRL